MLKNKRLLLLPIVQVFVSIVILATKIAYPYHRWIAFSLILSGCIPLFISYCINRRILKYGKIKIKRKVRPYVPHIVVAIIIGISFYAAWVLFPVRMSLLTSMPASELQLNIESDHGNYLILRKSLDNIVRKFESDDLLTRSVESLSLNEKKSIRSLWREGVMAFLELDLLKEKYSGFYQRDYMTEPALHSDSFFLAYAAFITQYNACLTIYKVVGENEFMETLLNESQEGIPPNTFLSMKKRITHPKVALKLNAGTVYYELVKGDITLDESTVTDFEKRRNNFFQQLSQSPGLFLKNPLDLLERFAFESWFPFQKHVAVQMSFIRTANRDYLITPSLIDSHKHKFSPCDIMLQRRNWHMTNIGIPGFWPHSALYVGSPNDVESYFSDLGINVLDELRTLFPDAFEKWSSKNHKNVIIEAKRPGVIFQPLELSANCDYLAVVRPNLTKQQKFEVLKNAFEHYGKPYDLNFDFTTENELVCSELVYKSFSSLKEIPFKTEIINGRHLLSPNKMAEQIATDLQSDSPGFEFILFLDAIEKTDEIRNASEEVFCQSWKRVKWDIMQE